MPIIASARPPGDFHPAPQGLHRAVCIDVVDKGLVDDQWGRKHKVQLRWALEEIDEKATRYNPATQERELHPAPFLVTKLYTLSLDRKANLRKDLEAWRGRAFTPEELKGFDLERLVGVNCQLQIGHSLGNNGTTYANIQAIVAASKNQDPLQVPEDYVRVADREQRGDSGGGTTYRDDTPF